MKTNVWCRSILPLARCIGDILNAENYELHYIGGSDLDFAGKGNFYETHNFNKVQGWYELEKILDDKIIDLLGASMMTNC